MERVKAPNAAFACVFEHRGIEYKLGRHHKLDSVRDGSEHDTVDAALLSFAIRTVDQLPVNDATREEIRQHLKDHEAALAKDVNRETVEGDENKAKRIVTQQTGGEDGNETLTNPVVDGTMAPEASTVVRKESGTTVAQLAQKTGSGNIDGGKPTQKGEKDTDAGRPKGDQKETLDVPANSDVETKTGKGTPAHPAKVSEGPVDSARPSVETDGGITVETSPAINDPANIPTSKGTHTDTKKADSNPRDALPKGAKPKGAGTKKGKAQDDSEPTKKGPEKGDPKAQDDGDKVVKKK